MKVTTLTFNPFEENTYILSDDTGECMIIDPGCSSAREEQILSDAIKDQGLKPVMLVNTHAHIDHVFGIDYVHKTYGLDLHLHEGELTTLKLTPQIGAMYGIAAEPVNAPVKFIAEGDVLSFGETRLEILLTPGHSPASICLYHRESQQLIAGDVLFQRSIGRTDLPGGDYDILIGSITDKLFPLGDEVTVYPGHGQPPQLARNVDSIPFWPD